MQFVEGRKELVWAYQTKPGFTGEAPGNYFRYFHTKAEAEKSVCWMERKKRWHGPIIQRPGECYELGSFVF